MTWSKYYDCEVEKINIFTTRSSTFMSQEHVHPSLSVVTPVYRWFITKYFIWTEQLDY